MFTQMGAPQYLWRKLGTEGPVMGTDKAPVHHRPLQVLTVCITLATSYMWHRVFACYIELRPGKFAIFEIPKIRKHDTVATAANGTCVG